MKLTEPTFFYFLRDEVIVGSWLYKTLDRNRFLLKNYLVWSIPVDLREDWTFLYRRNLARFTKHKSPCSGLAELWNRSTWRRGEIQIVAVHWYHVLQTLVHGWNEFTGVDLSWFHLIWIFLHSYIPTKFPNQYANIPKLNFKEYQNAGSVVDV